MSITAFDASFRPCAVATSVTTVTAEAASVGSDDIAALCRLHRLKRLAVDILVVNSAAQDTRIGK